MSGVRVPRTSGQWVQWVQGGITQAWQEAEAMGSPANVKKRVIVSTCVFSHYSTHFTL